MFGIWLYLFCSAWTGWIMWMVSDCLGYLFFFFTSPLYFENCQSSADSVFSNPCHGFCNQRKKSIFRCHRWMCVTLTQRSSIHHRNTLKGGQTLSPASGPDINDFCGQPNGKHFVFIYSVKKGSWSVKFVKSSHTPAQDICVGFFPDETIWRSVRTHAHTSKWCSLKLNFCHYQIS